MSGEFPIGNDDAISPRMTPPNSATLPAARMVTTVDRYDAAKGYGFLTPGGGLPDIFCHASALERVGLETLLDGATVTCETMRGDRGPQVARILAVDFTTVSPVPGEHGMEGDRDLSPPAAPTGEDPVTARVKWFLPSKGYGFLERGDGSGDVFCHLTAVQASGREFLPQGAAVTCEVAETERGPQVTRILAVDDPPDRDAAAEDRHPHGIPDPAWRDAAPDEAAVSIPGTVKFYDARKGYGFVVPDGGGREVYVNRDALFRSGLDGLVPGQRVSVWAEEVPRGLQATEIEPIGGAM